MLNRIRPLIYRMLITQALVVAVFAIALFFYKGMDIAYAALLGGIVNVLANLYFAKRVFTYIGAQAAKKIIKIFYKAEMTKILLTGALFAITLKWQWAQPFPFFLGYIIAQLGFWLAAVTAGRGFQPVGSKS